MKEGVNVGKATVLKESDKALLVRIEDQDGELWVPKSQIHDDSEVYKTDQSGDLVVSAWYAERQGWV